MYSLKSAEITEEHVSIQEKKKRISVHWPQLHLKQLIAAYNKISSFLPPTINIER